MPIYLGAVAVFAAADVLLRGGHHGLGLCKPLLFLTGYLFPLQADDAVPFTITWSLSVEVAAYFIMGILAWSAWRFFRIVVVLIADISPLARIWLAAELGWNEGEIGVFPPIRFDAIALGALVSIGAFARLLDIARAPLMYGLVCAGLIVAFRYAAWFPPFIGTVGYSIFGLVAALWVAALARSAHPGGWATHALASIGLVSYFMYLFHLFVVEGLLVADSLTGRHLGFWSALASTVALTYAAGLASWRYFEQPLIRYAHRRGS